MQIVIVTIRGKQYQAKLLKTHPCGTIDIQLPSGNCFRVSGLQIGAQA